MHNRARLREADAACDFLSALMALAQGQAVDVKRACFGGLHADRHLSKHQEFSSQGRFRRSP